MRTPEYILMERAIVSAQQYLETGSFVKPINDYYLPKHIKDSIEYQWYNPDIEVFCYTHYGIICIAKRKIRKV